MFSAFIVVFTKSVVPVLVEGVLGFLVDLFISVVGGRPFLIWAQVVSIFRICLRPFSWNVFSLSLRALVRCAVLRPYRSFDLMTES